MEQPSQDPAKMELAFQAAAETGIPVDQLRAGRQDRRRGQLAAVDRLDRQAGAHGRKLRRDPVRQGPRGRRHLQHAHHPAADGSHHLPGLWHRHGPFAHLPRRREPGRGDRRPSSRGSSTSTSATARAASRDPANRKMQANGRGDIDLLGYIRVLHQAGYTGPLDLEVIGAKSYSLVQCAVIAAEARGHMQACLQACGER